MPEEIKTQVVNEDATQAAAQQSETQAAEEQERFDTEYVRKLRAEAAGYRTRLKELESKVKAEEEAKLTEQERLQKRLAELERKETESFPHTRGDEPLAPARWREACKVFPTRVGMNRWCADAVAAGQ